MLRVRRRKTMKTRKTLDSTCNLPPEAFPKTPPKKKITRNSQEILGKPPGYPQRIPRTSPGNSPRKFRGNSWEIPKKFADPPGKFPGHPQEIPRKFADPPGKFPGNSPIPSRNSQEIPPGNSQAILPGNFVGKFPGNSPPGRSQEIPSGNSPRNPQEISRKFAEQPAENERGAKKCFEFGGEKQ